LRSTAFLTIGSSPSAVVISYSAVPSYVPSSVIQTVPSSNVAYVTAPPTVTIPSTWSSPVVVASSVVSSLPSA
jgi:hypothetical protein